MIKTTNIRAVKPGQYDIVWAIVRSMKSPSSFMLPGAVFDIIAGVVFIACHSSPFFSQSLKVKILSQHI